jgi:hypothetical protein
MPVPHVDEDAFAAAFHAAFHGRPADGVAALQDLADALLDRPQPGAEASGPAAGPGVDPADVPQDARWLLGVCLGAMGRYDHARQVLMPPGVEPDSMSASARASHLRQLGRHAEAEPLDQLAARLAAAAPHPETAQADAVVGLVADAVGTAASDLAASRLAFAEGHVAELPEPLYWREHVRLAWVRAEALLMWNAPDDAHRAAADALRISRAAAAPRHEAKSLLLRGVAGHVLGRPDAAQDLAAAAAKAEQLGVPTLVWPARLVLMRLLAPVDPEAAERERAAARAAVLTIAGGLPPDEAVAFLAGEGPTSL